MWALVAGIGWALYIVLGHRLARARELRPQDGLATGLAVGGIVLAPFFAWRVGPVFNSAGIFARAALVAVASNAVPYSLEQLAMRRLARGRFAVMLALLPVSATVMGLVVLGQTPSVGDAVGIALVIGGDLADRRSRGGGARLPAIGRGNTAGSDCGLSAPRSARNQACRSLGGRDRGSSFGASVSTAAGAAGLLRGVVFWCGAGRVDGARRLRDRWPGQLCGVPFGRAFRRIGPVGSAVIALQVARATREHWQTIPRAKRKRLQSLLRQSRGRPANLSKAERRELGKLVKALHLSRLVQKSVLSASGIHRQLHGSQDSEQDSE